MPNVTNTGAFLIHAGGTRMVPTIPAMVDDKWMTHPHMQLMIDNGTVVVETAPELPPEEETNRRLNARSPGATTQPTPTPMPTPEPSRQERPITPSRPVPSATATTGRPETKA